MVKTINECKPKKETKDRICLKISSLESREGCRIIFMKILSEVVELQALEPTSLLGANNDIHATSVEAKKRSEEDYTNDNIETKIDEANLQEKIEKINNQVEEEGENIDQGGIEE